MGIDLLVEFDDSEKYRTFYERHFMGLSCGKWVWVLCDPLRTMFFFHGIDFKGFA